MVVIWGLDLKDMQWSKFKSSYMWNNEYHMRRTRFIIYQLAMILCVVSESLGTAALSDYVNQQDLTESLDATGTVHNDNFIGIASFNIFVGIYVATIFGSAFFFDLFWPERHESKSVRLAWRICSVFACMLTLACALAYTYIVATKSAYVTGLRAREVRLILERKGRPALKYRKNARAIASVVFLWPGMVFTFASTYLLWESLSHIAAYGPRSTHARNHDQVEKPVDRDVASPAESRNDGIAAELPGHEQPHSEGDIAAHGVTNTQHHSVV